MTLQLDRRGTDGFPRTIAPMLAQLARTPFDHPDWIVEPKWDGFRTVAYVRGGGSGHVNLRSRNLHDFTGVFWPVADALRAAPVPLVLDGEVVALDDRGRPDFEALQQRLARTAGRVAISPYFDSLDAGRTWARHMEGLRHRYLVGIAVDQEDSGTVIVSCADGPWSAYDPPRAESYVYRHAGRNAWHTAMDGLPDAEGAPDAPGAVYAANNHAVYHSTDGGRRWTALHIPWPRAALDGGVEALAALVEYTLELFVHVLPVPDAEDDDAPARVVNPDKEREIF